MDLMGAIFAGRFRNVPRKSHPRILDSDDPRTPIRTKAQNIMRGLHDDLHDAFPPCTETESRTRRGFCFQPVIGVAQTDPVNNVHLFKLENGSVLPGLKDPCAPIWRCRPRQGRPDATAAQCDPDLDR